MKLWDAQLEHGVSLLLLCEFEKIGDWTKNLPIMSDNDIKKLEIEYEDILADRRKGSDLRWAAREWEEVVTYKFRKKVHSKNFINQILRSDRVNHSINKLVALGESRNKIEKKVAYIVEDMRHSLDIGMIRKFAVTLPKIMKLIYNKILVNKSGIETIKESTEDAPILFLPTHRSYADFLLISYLTYHYNLPFPVIAAGMDFMSMAFIGDMLRGAGAFYIRRSFMDDSLYWAVFQEYVQSLICDSGQPMEFFLEGTRSRRLLGCVLECWIRAKLPDITIVPISISYNRTLEEKLYAYEMLGVPKPKESTSGLLKAMRILKEKFGTIYVHIGKGISVSKFLSPRVDRHLNVDPFYLSSLSPKEFNACESLAFHVLRVLQNNCVVSVWSLACVGLIRALWAGFWSLPFDTLYKEILNLARLAKKLGALVEGLDTTESIEDHLRRSLAEHCEVVRLSDSDNLVYIHKIHKEIADSKPVRLKDDVYQKFFVLSSIFSFDFIFESDYLKQDVNEALAFLEDEQCIIQEAERSHYFLTQTNISKENSHSEGDTLKEFLAVIIKPFLLNYQEVTRFCRTSHLL
ncbi:Dihydroxyacetone phosphate acyltransferase [Armadillidium vulgare]|nr:Dihydroxyacetone phosphate acyltransferase [Armadillidium vulgare]